MLLFFALLAFHRQEGLKSHKLIGKKVLVAIFLDIGIGCKSMLQIPN